MTTPCTRVDPDVFYPGSHGGDRDLARHQERIALALCAGCPIRVQCHAYVMRFETARDTRHGIWGGTTPRQRDQLARMRDTQRVAAGQDRDRWENVGEPSRGALTPQPGSDRLHLGKKGGGW